MDHIAIDLGGRESQICVRRSDGQILEERRHATVRLKSYLERRAAGRVIVESSAEAFHVADQAIACGHEVRVVPATLVVSLGVGSRGVKTDRRDAQLLSEVSCRIELPSIHLPSSESRRMRSVCASREALVRSRTLLVNHVRGYLRTCGLSVRGGGVSTVPERLRRRLDEIPEHLERNLRMIEQLSMEVAVATKDLTELAKSNEICRRLMTVPGVGPVTSVRFVAALDTHVRFGNAHDVESYLGLTPGERSSSDKKRRTGITKAGSPRTRWVLVQAAWSAFRTRPHDPMVVWARRVAERRGRRVAVTALARKLAGILYALWRDGTTYDPTRGADRPAQL